MTIAQVIAQVVNFCSNLIVQIISIPIRNDFTLGDLVIIIIVLVMVLKFFEGRKGD